MDAGGEIEDFGRFAREIGFLIARREPVKEAGQGGRAAATRGRTGGARTRLKCAAM